MEYPQYVGKTVQYCTDLKTDSLKISLVKESAHRGKGKCMRLTKGLVRTVCWETSRSHRLGGVERYLLGAIGILPYRWLDCDARFYAFSRFGAGTSVTDKVA